MPRILGAALIGAIVPAEAAGEWYPYDVNTWVSIGDLICKEGNEQSPVDFPNCPEPIARIPPTFTWTNQKVKIDNNGHTVQLTVDPDRPDLGAIANDTITGGMEFVVEGLTKYYVLLQCHFHHGSEHTVGGKQYPMEVHCVHQMPSSDEGVRYGVAGFFYEQREEENAFLADFEDHLPDHTDSVSKRRLEEYDFSYNLMGDPMDVNTHRRLAGTRVVSSTWNANTLLDFTKLYSITDLFRYYNYAGSLTTPPCPEVVDFYIFWEPQPVKAATLTKFKDAMGWKVAGGNYRPPQPLVDRTVWGCTMEPPKREDDPWYPYSANTWANRVGVKSNRVCDGGSAQSPIDFASCEEMDAREKIMITWAKQKVQIVNNGHTVVINTLPETAEKGEMRVAGKVYTLVQCHTHWSSEHTVGGMQYPFEQHCVHAKVNAMNDEDIHYGVFGLFYTVGDADDFLSIIQNDLPKAPYRRLKGSSRANVDLDLMGRPVGRHLASAHGDAVSDFEGPLDFKALYGSNPRTHYWSYGGSFTTPPCTEAVDFYIMMQPSSIGKNQLDMFKAAIGWSAEGGNFRPPQALGARVVAGCISVKDGGYDFTEQFEAPFVSASMQDAVNLEVRDTVQSVLVAEQDGHTDLLVALVVLATILSVFLCVGVVVLMLVWVKSK